MQPDRRGFAPGRTIARVAVEGRRLLGAWQSLPRKAVDRLHALVQTAA